MKFNVKDYPGDYAMLVDSREDIESFCKILDAQGRTWVDGRSYREYMSYYPQYTFLRWSDFKNDATPSITLNFEDIFGLKTEKE